MARQCTKHKRLRNLTWFKENMLLVEALESRVVLDAEQMAFLEDNEDTITTSQESQEIPTPSIFQTDDLDAFDTDCDEALSASATMMAKLSAYDSNVLSKVPTHDTYLDNHVIDQSVQEMQYSEQPPFINDPVIDITNDSNVISYEQYLKETENEVVQATPSPQQDAMIMFMIKDMSYQVAKCNEVNKEKNKIVNESLTTELERYKEQIKYFEERKKFDLNDKEKYIDGQLREESKAKEDKYLEEIIDLEKKNKALDNVVYKMDNTCVVPANDNNLAYVEMEQSFIDEYSRCVKLEAELSKKNYMVEKDVYNELSKMYLRIEQHCIYFSRPQLV
ncbi:hypothetical protein Tco_0874516 [Tanacetum coccineum]|uniref:Uncharacterized protein n=1 Tax=Tanacetum coccineum TaxID=301880 RepID=A0ABQ5BLT8_9ASTR